MRRALKTETTIIMPCKETLKGTEEFVHPKFRKINKHCAVSL